MKKELHPEYKKCMVTCACGNTFETRSTLDKIHVEICSQCHPFYTGKQKLVDSAGRVERFHRRYRKDRVKPQSDSVKKSAKVEEKAQPAAEPAAAIEAKSAESKKAKSTDKS